MLVRLMVGRGRVGWMGLLLTFFVFGFFSNLLLLLWIMWGWLCVECMIIFGVGLEVGGFLVGFFWWEDYGFFVGNLLYVCRGLYFFGSRIDDHAKYQNFFDQSSASVFDYKLSKKETIFSSYIIYHGRDMTLNQNFMGSAWINTKRYKDHIQK